MTKLPNWKTALVALGMTVAAAPAMAGAAWEFTSAGNDFRNNNWDFAYSFSVNTPTTASGLGFYASPTNGQVVGNPVALYQCSNLACNGTGTLLASATVTNVYALQGHFRYVTIAPIALTPGVGYQVAGASLAGNYTWNDVGFTTDPSINFTFNASRWQVGTTPIFLPGIAGGVTEGYWGPNVFLGAATFTGKVPEPAAWALMIGGFGLVGAAQRRRRRAYLAA